MSKNPGGNLLFTLEGRLNIIKGSENNAQAIKNIANLKKMISKISGNRQL